VNKCSPIRSVAISPIALGPGVAQFVVMSTLNKRARSPAQTHPEKNLLIFKPLLV